MRYELTDFEWTAIRPFLPNKPRGVPRVNDRRALNRIFWILRSGAPWRDLPESFGPYTTCYNRFVRWRMAGIWDLIMKSLATLHGVVFGIFCPGPAVHRRRDAMPGPGHETVASHLRDESIQLHHIML